MDNKNKDKETQGVELSTDPNTGLKSIKKRAVTISVTAEQIKELSKNETLRDLVIQQMNDSEGGLKGNLAIQIAKAMIRQLKMKI